MSEAKKKGGGIVFSGKCFEKFAIFSPCQLYIIFIQHSSGLKRRGHGPLVPTSLLIPLTIEGRKGEETENCMNGDGLFKMEKWSK